MKGNTVTFNYDNPPKEVITAMANALGEFIKQEHQFAKNEEELPNDRELFTMAQILWFTSLAALR